ncbi:UDP-glucuronosyltransferase 1-2-like [Oncorhynchus masou masou]|uniref:UDP-glucuronosyltransferase 1-2-like n=1 Tax=Oncorhynchus masou masou TaxID=90313 RepID=UPI00318310BA
MHAYVKQLVKMCLPGIFIVTLLTLSIPAVHGGKVLVFPQEGSHWVNMKVIIEELHSRVCEMIIKMLENKQLMQSIRETKYDLVLTDPLNGGGVVLAHYLNVPLVFNVRWTIGELTRDINKGSQLSPGQSHVME